MNYRGALLRADIGKDKQQKAPARHGRAKIVRRLAAFVTLALGLAGLAFMVVLAIADFPRGFYGLIVLIAAAAAAWLGLVRRGARRMFGLLAAALLAGVFLVFVIEGEPALVLGSLVTLSMGLGAVRAAFRIRVALPPAPRPTHPVLSGIRARATEKLCAFAWPTRLVRAASSQSSSSLALISNS